MKAEIVAIGTELLLGEITDANSPYLASQLPPLGIDLYWISIVGDNMGRMLDALRRAWERSDLILTTGGLGPTDGDITRQAIASLLGEEMKVDRALEEELRGLFAQRGIKMPPSNIRQATLIPSAKPLHNIRGTAPGWWVEKEGRLLICMPGPPNETRRMWEGEVLPLLRARVGGEVILSRTLKTAGLSEAAVNELVKPFLGEANPTLAIYAKNDGIQLRIAAKATRTGEAHGLIVGREKELRSRLGDYVWGVDGQTLEGVVGDLLSSSGLTLAVMESCTGGLLADTLTNVAGSSSYFKGGVVAYTPETKVACGVDRRLIDRFGVVSAEVAEAMASAVRSLLKADVGVGVTGVAGPDPLDNKPVGTVEISIDDAKGSLAVSFCLAGNRVQVKQRATNAALNMIRKRLLERH